MCPICGTVFQYSGYYVPKCCSPACAQESRSTHFRGPSKICKQCGKEYRKQNKDFCSKSCYNEHQASKDNPLRRRDLRLCDHCGKEFEALHYTDTRFCSRDCANQNRRENPTAGVNRPALQTHFCEYCGKPFEAWAYRKDAKFCSIECKHASKPRTVKTCVLCGQDFEVQNHRKTAKYCSVKCSRTHRQLYRSSRSKAEIEIDTYLEDLGLSIVTDLRVTHPLVPVIVPDIQVGRAVIEYFGDYWHCNPAKYAPDYYNKSLAMTAEEKWAQDLLRCRCLSDCGFSVLIIWESDYQENPIVARQKCLKFVINKYKGEICDNV